MDILYVTYTYMYNRSTYTYIHQPNPPNLILISPMQSDPAYISLTASLPCSLSQPCKLPHSACTMLRTAAAAAAHTQTALWISRRHTNPKPQNPEKPQTRTPGENKQLQSGLLLRTPRPWRRGEGSGGASWGDGDGGR